MHQHQIRDYRDDGSEIYVVDNYYRQSSPPPPMHHNQIIRPTSTIPSNYSSVTTSGSKRKGGVVVEAMSAPNPFCPHSKGVCCLLLLVNLGLILLTLGFSIVLQLFDPPFVWYCGILFLIVGFIALISSLIFCVHLCRHEREARERDSRDNNHAGDGNLYWTHHWQKRIDI